YFLVNGRPFSGARPITHWEAIVEEEIEAANALGVERAKVYETLMKDAKTTRGGGGSVGGAPSARANRRAGPLQDLCRPARRAPAGRPRRCPGDDCRVLRLPVPLLRKSCTHN
ncbi:MAG: hypothetical protein ACPG4T_24820, partial [Nannocystaceae bacterium]